MAAELTEREEAVLERLIRVSEAESINSKREMISRTADELGMSYLEVAVVFKRAISKTVDAMFESEQNPKN